MDRHYLDVEKLRFLKRLYLRIFNFFAVTQIFWFPLAVAIVVTSDKGPVNLGGRVTAGYAPVKIYHLVIYTFHTDFAAKLVFRILFLRYLCCYCIYV